MKVCYHASLAAILAQQPRTRRLVLLFGLLAVELARHMNDICPRFFTHRFIAKHAVLQGM
jgi:hypothetical protein